MYLNDSIAVGSWDWENEETEKNGLDKKDDDVKRKNNTETKTNGGGENVKKMR